MHRPLYIEVNLDALGRNLAAIRKILGAGVGVAAVIKQSAYGHGLLPVAKHLSSQGVDFFGVGSIEEAVALKENDLKDPVLVLSNCLPRAAEYFIEYGIIPTVMDMDFARGLNQVARQQGIVFPAHIKIDTGMGRLGVDYRLAYSFIKSLKELGNISLQGLYTHFPCADNDVDFTNHQIAVFNEFVDNFKKEGVSFQFYHCANSCGLAKYAHSHCNMVRPGLILYGINPCAGIDLDIEPVLSLKSKVIFIKRIEKGATVSYGRTYTAREPCFIATIAVGYADGYPWNLSNKAKVIIKDSFFDVVGRVCMDHIMVNLGNRADINPGDDVILIGRQGNLEVSASHLARWAGTIPYEIVSRLSLKIPRFYKSNLGVFACGNCQPADSFVE